MDGFLNSLQTGTAAIGLWFGLSATPVAPLPPPTPTEMTRLKEDVRIGIGSSIVPYASASALADYPQLKDSQGRPKFMMGFIGSTDFTGKTIAQSLQAQLGQPASWSAQWDAAQLGAKIYHEHEARLGAVSGNDPKTMGFTHTYNAQNILFNSVALNPAHCPDCAVRWDTSPKTCDIKNPATIRVDHLISTATAEHEMGHVVSQQLGLKKQRIVKNATAPDDWHALAEENYAYTYEALRMIQTFGKEGAKFIESELYLRVIMAKGGSSSHWPIASFANVLEYAKYHDLGKMPSGETALLAERLSVPPSPAQYIALRQQLDKPLPATSSSFALAALPRSSDLSGHARLYEFYAPNIDARMSRARAELAALNPQLPASFTPEESMLKNGPFSRAQIDDLTHLNDGRRKAGCEPIIQVVQRKMAPG